MKRYTISHLLLSLIGVIFFSANVFAADLYLNATLATDYYQSDGIIHAQAGCTVPAGKNVRFLAQGGVILETSFTVEAGSTFGVIIGDVNDVPADADIDADDLPDGWELANFGDISQSRDGDYDSDGHSNFAEYNLETNPADGNDAPDPDDYDEAVDYGLAAAEQLGDRGHCSLRICHHLDLQCQRTAFNGRRTAGGHGGHRYLWL